MALSALPDVCAVLGDVYAVALDTLEDEEAHLLLKALEVELEMVAAEPWDYERVTSSLARLPSPILAELPPSPRQADRAGPRELLTPKGWSFLWELGHAGLQNLPDILNRYSGGLGCDVCDGLYLAAVSIAGDSEQADEALSCAISALMEYVDGSPETLGETLTLGTSHGPVEVHIGVTGLHRPSVSELLLRLAEMVPAVHPRRSELLGLYRVFTAAEQCEPLEDEDDAGEDMPGLAWLCEQSLSFQFAAATVIQGVGGRMRLALDALCRSVETHDQPTVAVAPWLHLQCGELPEQHPQAVE